MVPGAGAFEVYLNKKLLDSSNEVTGKAQLGYNAFAEAVLIVPKILA